MSSVSNRSLFGLGKFLANNEESRLLTFTTIVSARRRWSRHSSYLRHRINPSSPRDTTLRWW